MLSTHQFILLYFFKEIISCFIYHCFKKVFIRSYSGLYFCRISPYSVRMRENLEKMRTRITPKTDSFYTVYILCKFLTPIFQSNCIFLTKTRIFNISVGSSSLNIFSSLFFTLTANNKKN